MDVLLGCGSQVSSPFWSVGFFRFFFLLTFFGTAHFFIVVTFTAHFFSFQMFCSYFLSPFLVSCCFFVTIFSTYIYLVSFFCAQFLSPLSAARPHHFPSNFLHPFFSWPAFFLPVFFCLKFSHLTKRQPQINPSNTNHHFVNNRHNHSIVAHHGYRPQSATTVEAHPSPHTSARVSTTTQPNDTTTEANTPHSS